VARATEINGGWILDLDPGNDARSRRRSGAPGPARLRLRSRQPADRLGRSRRRRGPSRCGQRSASPESQRSSPRFGGEDGRCWRRDPARNAAPLAQPRSACRLSQPRSATSSAIGPKRLGLAISVEVRRAVDKAYLDPRRGKPRARDRNSWRDTWLERQDRSRIGP